MSEKLDTGIEPEIEQLRDRLGSGFQGELLGYGVAYTVAGTWNCLVPRDWLVNRCEELDIPEEIVPKKVKPGYAYDRAIKRMRESWLDSYYIESPRLDSGEDTVREVQVVLKEGDGSRVWHARAEVFFSEDESKQEGGKWVTRDLGQFHYDLFNNEDDPKFHALTDEQLDEDDYLMEVWQDVSSAGEALFRQMQHVHHATDIRNMMYLTIKNRMDTVIKLQRSLYLFPATLVDFVDKMATLYREINEQFKTGGEPMLIRTFELLNTDEKQEWISYHVEKTLEDNIDKMLTNAFEKFDEGQAASEVVKIIRENLSSDEHTAETYNGLLEAEISIEEVLEKQKEEASDIEKEALIEEVIEQSDIGDFGP